MGALNSADAKRRTCFARAIELAACGCGLLLCSASCSSEDPKPEGKVLVEYQRRHRDNVIDTDWSQLSAIVVTDAAAFPQPLSVRVRVVNDAGADLGVAHLYFGLYGATQLEEANTASGCIYPLPDEAAAYCTYDFNVVGPGSNMFLATANAPSGPTLRDCLYYDAIVAATDPEAERVALEARAVACRGK